MTLFSGLCGPFIAINRPVLTLIRISGYISGMHRMITTFKALADETRLRILALLLDGELCVCDLMTTLELPQSTVSRHLAYLRNAGWVADRRSGIWTYYSISPEKENLRHDLLLVLKKYFAACEPVIRDRNRLTEAGKSDC